MFPIIPRQRTVLFPQDTVVIIQQRELKVKSMKFNFEKENQKKKGCIPSICLPTSHFQNQKKKPIATAVKELEQLSIRFSYPHSTY